MQKKIAIWETSSAIYKADFLFSDTYTKFL